MSKLASEQQTDAVGERVELSFLRWADSGSHSAQGVFEHGHWWVSCVDCGAQWSVVDVGTVDPEDKDEDALFDFERVTEGDGSCDERED